ncbi:MAG TPA: SDR family NAD(P)-dependent oxidoreductase, partial [Paracoccaceae bacterium]|nr:SDR family NAD(P)-dependent oxidoreductase [Paracoccaceae bacterium]
MSEKTASEQLPRQPGMEHDMQREPKYMPRYPGSGRLDGKVAIITGGDSGIGRATAILFAREGAKVAIIYLDEHEDAEKTLSHVKNEGAEGLLIAGDVGQKAFCEDAVARVIDNWGRLDVLVNDAGEQHAVEDVEDISEAQIER